MRRYLSIFIVIILCLRLFTPTPKILVWGFTPEVFCAEAPEKETLALRLMGTIVEPDFKKSIAVIKNLNSQKQGIYKLNDKLLGYQVVRIERGKIILLKQNKLFNLELPLGAELEPITVVSSDKRIINRNALVKKIPNLNAARLQALPILYIESGKIKGFKLTQLKDKDLAKSAGIKEGDIVMSVNGQHLDGLRKTLQVYHSLNNQDKFDIQIKRGAQIQNLTYYIN